MGSGPDVSRLYQTPEMLWLICPVLLYWITRVWLLTQRGEMNDDPIVFLGGGGTCQIAAFHAIQSDLHLRIR